MNSKITAGPCEMQVAPSIESGSAVQSSSTLLKLDRAENYFNWLSLVVAVAVVVISGLTAGPLWRDEIHSLYIAQLPLSSIGQWPFLDSSPLVHYFPFRLGTMIMPGGEIVATRLTGILICLGCVLAFVGATRALGKRGPYPLAAFLLVQPFFARYLLTVRTYGVSTLFGILTLWSFWSYFAGGGRKKWALATLCGLLFLHSNYANACYYVLLTGTFFAFLLLQSQGRRAIVVAITAACSLASLLVYVPGLRHLHDAETYLLANVSIWTYLLSTADYLSGGFTFFYYVVLALILVGLIQSLRQQPKNRAVWLGVILALGCPLLQHLFLWQSGSPYSVWYLLVPATLAALGAEVALDHAVRLSSRPVTWRVLRLILMGLIFLVMLPRNYHGITERITNMDAVASCVENEGRPGDSIIVVPFYYGNSFHHYYHGPIPWQTVPALPDFNRQRFDLMLPYLQNLRGGWQSSPVIGQARAALQKGGRLWVVGQPIFDLRASDMARLRVPANTTLGRRFGILNKLSQAQVGALMQTQGFQIKRIDLLPGTAINQWERADLYRVDP